MDQDTSASSVSTTSTQHHVHNISKITLIIALVALVLLVALYAVMKSQAEKKETASTNIDTQSTQSVSPEQLNSMNATYESRVAELVEGYMNGESTAQETGLELEKVGVTSTYKSLHARLSALFFGNNTDEQRKAQLESIDVQYSWLLQ